MAGLCLGVFVVEPELGIETETRFVLDIESKPAFILPRNTEREGEDDPAFFQPLDVIKTGV